MRHVERELRKLIFARAALKLEARSPANSPCHPKRAPTGFKRSVGRCGALRLVTRNLLPKLRGYLPPNALHASLALLAISLLMCAAR